MEKGQRRDNAAGSPRKGEVKLLKPSPGRGGTSDSPGTRGVLPLGDRGRLLRYEAIKRVVDFASAGVGLVLLGPVLALIGSLIVLTSGRPVLYRGVRVGRAGRPFRILKFRSMVPDAERIGNSVTRADDQRITRIGRFLRWLKLDELPQLWNVVRGEMSLVGPRPEAPEVVATYSEDMKRILSIRPGITSVASLQLRNEVELLASVPNPVFVYVNVIVPWKVDAAMEHADRRSVMFDLRILYLTIAIVVFRCSPRCIGKGSLDELRRRIAVEGDQRG